MLQKDSTNRKASNNLINTGFNYLYKDIKTAKYRFNQAYLLDSTNTDIYWGFGAIYMDLGEHENAWEFYDDCKINGGQPITKKYTNDLTTKCSK